MVVLRQQEVEVADDGVGLRAIAEGDLVQLEDVPLEGGTAVGAVAPAVQLTEWLRRLDDSGERDQ